MVVFATRSEISTLASWLSISKGSAAPEPAGRAVSVPRPPAGCAASTPSSARAAPTLMSSVQSKIRPASPRDRTDTRPSLTTASWPPRTAACSSRADTMPLPLTIETTIERPSMRTEANADSMPIDASAVPTLRPVALPVSPPSTQISPRCSITAAGEVMPTDVPGASPMRSPLSSLTRAATPSPVEIRSPARSFSPMPASIAAAAAAGPRSSFTVAGRPPLAITESTTPAVSGSGAGAGPPPPCPQAWPARRSRDTSERIMPLKALMEAFLRQGGTRVQWHPGARSAVRTRGGPGALPEGGRPDRCTAGLHFAWMGFSRP